MEIKPVRFQEYEPPGAEFYTPDFWLPAHSAFVEVKPVEPDERAIRKIADLVKARRQRVYVAVGLPAPGDLAYAYLFSPGTGAGPWVRWDTETPPWVASPHFQAACDVARRVRFP